MKIKFGALVTDGRGKLGGHVASKNRSGNYLRTKVTPVNPRSEYQQTVRANFTTTSQGWGSLTPAQRSGWDGAVADWAKTDIFGDIKNPTGKNLYTKLNCNNLLLGNATVDVVPTKISPPKISLNSAVYDISTPALTIDVTGEGVVGVIAFSATNVLSDGTTFTKGKFRYLISDNMAPTISYDLLSDYLNRFGAISAADNIYVQVQSFTFDGQPGAIHQVKVIYNP